MATVSDVLYYSIELNFSEKVNDDDYDNLRSVKRILVIEFEDYNLNKLIQVLNLADCLIVSITVGSLDDILGGTHTLREIFLSHEIFKLLNKNDEICNWICSKKWFYI